MLNYTLSKLAKRPKGAKIVLPPVQASLAAEKEYYAALRRVLTQAAAETRLQIIPLYQAELAAKRTERAFTADAESSWFTRLRAMINRLTGTASQTVNNILGLEAQRHSKNFMATAKKALGIDLAAVISDEDLTEHLQLAVSRNAALIQGFGEDIAKRIEVTIYNNAAAGDSVATLRKKLSEQFGISDRRAETIARTETAKFNSELNKIRQQQAGLSAYVYMTSHDERVRSLHRSFDGETFKWSTPPSDGHPGTAVNCRCISRGIVEF